MLTSTLPLINYTFQTKRYCRRKSKSGLLNLRTQASKHEAQLDISENDLLNQSEELLTELLLNRTTENKLSPTFAVMRKLYSTYKP